MDLSKFSESQQALYKLLTPEQRVTVEAYELAKADAIATRTCVDVPGMGCGKPVNVDDVDDWAEGMGFPTPPVEVKLELIDLFERMGVCPTCFMQHMTELISVAFTEVDKRMAAQFN